MSSLTYFRPDVLFQQTEVSQRNDAQLKRESRIQQIKDQLNEEFQMTLHFATQDPTHPSTIRKLKEEYNKLAFKNKQKTQTLEQLKIEWKLLNPPKIKQDSRFLTSSTLSQRQITCCSSFKFNEGDYEDLIANLKEEISKTTELLSVEDNVTEQLEFMKDLEKKDYLKLQTKLDELRFQTGKILRFEEEILETQTKADNQLILALTEMKSTKHEIEKEKVNREEKIESMVRKEEKLKSNIATLAHRFSENMVLYEENNELRISLEKELEIATQDYSRLKSQNKQFQAQLEFYNTEFEKIKQIVKESGCLGADPQLVASYTPQEIASALFSMISIESQLQKRFVELTSIHNSLKSKCETIFIELKELKEEAKFSDKIEEIKNKAHIIMKNDEITTNELLSSIDEVNGNSARAEIIKKYEKFSVYSIKYLISVFTKMWKQIEMVASKASQPDSMNVYLNRSRRLFRDLQEGLTPKSHTKALTQLTRFENRRRKTVKVNEAPPKLETEIIEPVKTEINPYSKQELIKDYHEIFHMNNDIASMFATEVLKSIVSKYFLEKNDITSLLKEFGQDNNLDELRLEYLHKLYSEANKNLTKKFAFSIESLLSALNTVQRFVQDESIKISEIDIESLQKKATQNSISNITRTIKRRHSTKHTVEDLIKSVFQFKLKTIRQKKELRPKLKADFEDFVKSVKFDWNKNKDLQTNSDKFMGQLESDSDEEETEAKSKESFPEVNKTSTSKSVMKARNGSLSMINLPRIGKRYRAMSEIREIESKIQSVKHFESLKKF
ncbi:unnamed protein product [Blepharisma stoltei]|uniref:Uncharacterized protein n=1 Tax=Blepharisma stoltei TaxID=1481888 RepID=A0AAU9KG68_9CILI|nr:unnamed protein product [Blepharisma stoltei]